MVFILNRRTLIRLQQYNNGKKVINPSYNMCAYCNHLSLMVYHNDNPSVICNKCSMDWAARYGNLDIVRFLHNNRTEGCTHWAMNWSACHGCYLDIVRFLHYNRTEGCTKYAIDSALRNNHTDIVNFLKEHYPQFAN